MLGPAVNRQPGFRRGLVEQSNAAKNNPLSAGCVTACCCSLLLTAEAALCSLAAAAGCIFVWPTGLPTGWFLPRYLSVWQALTVSSWLWLLLALADSAWLTD